MSSGKNIRKTSWYKGLDKVEKNFIERLTVDPRSPGDRDTTLKYTGNTIQKIFNKQLQNIEDIRNVFKVLPQLNFPRKVLVSSILSPGDITKTGIIVDNSLKLTDYSLSSQMTNMVRELLTEELEVPTKISRWIDEALILEGAHAIVTLPSSVVDSVMEVSMESSSRHKVDENSLYFKPLGLIGCKNDKGEVISVEGSTRLDGVNLQPWKISGNIDGKKSSKKVELPIVITDNPAILAKSILNEARASNVARQIYDDLSIESMVRYPDHDGKKPKFMPSDVRRDMFKPANTTMDRIKILPTPREIEEDVNLGHPIEYHWPKDSIIPVSSPGDAEDHKNYILLLDMESGYAISGMDRLQYSKELQNLVRRSNDSQGVASTLLKSATDNLGLSNTSYDMHVINEMTRINSALIESEVTRSIMSGANGGNVKIELSESVSKLMLARTLKGQRTVMLYVPADYVTYIAFNYDELGLGKSILEDSKSMASMLSTLTVANVIGSVEQAIPGKDLSIKIDPNDRDPLGTATFMAREAMDLNFRRFPMGLNSTIGVAEELQMNSYSVSIEGHPAFPEVSTEMRAKESSRAPIDTELMDKLNDYMHLIFSVPPELIGSSNQADFATTVVANNLMLLKTVIDMQTIANKHLSRYGRNYVRYSGVMVARFFNLIKENKKSLPAEYKDDIPGFISDFIDSIKVTLPSPETNNLDHQIELLTNFGNAIDTAMDSYLNEESLLIEGYKPEIIQSVLPTIRASYKHYAMRQYMRERGIMSELDIFKIGDEDNPTIVLSEEIKGHSKHVIKSIRKFIEGMADVLKPEVTELKKTVKKDTKAKELVEEVNRAGEDEDDQDESADGYSYDAGMDSDSDDDDVDDGSDSDSEDSGDADSEGGDNTEDDEESLPSDEIDEDKLDGGEEDDSDEEDGSDEELPMDEVDEDRL